MNRFIRFLAASATAVIVVAAAGAPALAETASCGDFTGAAFGLCNAYCEAMACGSDNPRANITACTKVKLKFDANFSEPVELPCLAVDPEVDPSNTAPVVDLNGVPDDDIFDTTATFVSFGGAVPIALDVVITDGEEDDVIVSATITLKNPVAGENETLALTSEGLLLLEMLNTDLDPSGGTSVFNPDTGEFTITGTGTKQLYAFLIQQVVYDNGVDSPSLSAVRSIEVIVNDGLSEGESDPAFSDLTVLVGCPCTTLTSGFFINPSVWPFYKRFFDRDSLTMKWRITKSEKPPICEIRLDSKPGTMVSHFGLNWPLGEAPNSALVMFDSVVKDVEGGGQCSVDFSFRLDKGEFGFGLNQEIVLGQGVGAKRDGFIDDADPSEVIDVFTSDQAVACMKGQRLVNAFIKEWFEARGAICVQPQ